MTKDCDCMAKNQQPIVRGYRHPGLARPGGRRPGHGRSPRRQAGGQGPAARRRTTSTGPPSSPTARRSAWAAGRIVWSRSA
ncbi:MAG: hypothetical protein MZV70_52775 [Desulfobacterales bacterium]|nr:hypothetical protein [Desulfobacterales bacterium]